MNPAEKLAEQAVEQGALASRTTDQTARKCHEGMAEIRGRLAAKVNQQGVDGKPSPSIPCSTQPDLSSSVRAEHDPPQPPDLGALPDCQSPAERTLVELISQRDRTNPISAHELGAAIQRPERIARAIIQHLVIAHEICIASTPGHGDDGHGGYFWPARIEELDGTLAQLASRRREIDARIEGLRAGAYRRFKTMPLFEEPHEG